MPDSRTHRGPHPEDAKLFAPAPLRVPNPDPLLAGAAAVVASADGAVLDAAARSFNLARTIAPRALPAAWLVDLSDAA